MTLISLLIVMALERITNKSPDWHIHRLVGRYNEWLQQRRFIKHISDSPQSLLTLVIIALVPAGVTYLLITVSNNLFVTFALQLLVLWVCLGCPITRKTYKQYLQSANNKDYEACALHSIAFGNSSGDLNKVGEQLVYINYRHYAAVLVWFVLLGAPGVIFYSILKEWQTYAHKDLGRRTSSCNDTDIFQPHIDEADGDVSATNTLEGNHLSPSAIAIDQLMHIIDWLPTRITGLGFLLVGHFSRALVVWLPSWLDTSSHAKTILSNISIAAEDVDLSDGNEECIERPCTMVKLVKRNVMFLLVAVSILTMVGAVV